MLGKQVVTAVGLPQTHATGTRQTGGDSGSGKKKYSGCFVFVSADVIPLTKTTIVLQKCFTLAAARLESSSSREERV